MYKTTLTKTSPKLSSRLVRRNTKEDVFAKFRALALMMKARQKLRGVRPVIRQGLENDRQTGQRPSTTRGQRIVETGKVAATRASKDKDVTISAFGAMLREAEEDENREASHYNERYFPLMTHQCSTLQKKNLNTI